ncbi:MAG: hypothetical protein ACI4V2_07435 [Alloprevotella sp.]
MKTFTSILFSALFVGLVAAPGASAQKRRTVKNPSTVAKTPVETKSAEQLIDEYQFAEAAAVLQKQKAAAERAKTALDPMAQDNLRRARLGENMLRATERVAFVDSLVVDRADFWAHLGLSADGGRLLTAEGLKGIVPSVDAAGEVAYVNDFGDRVVFAAPDTARLLKLFTADRLADGWSEPVRLEGLGEAEEMQDYPFLCADGVTLYYGAQGPESLGGYDIFVTRYNSGTGGFVKPENVGMPFNSPANDFLMAIDETTGLGLFVTDRRQPADKVCIYRFIPSDSREVYDLSTATEADVISKARIDRLADSQASDRQMAAVRERLEAAGSSVDAGAAGGVKYVISDRVVYTSLAQFKDKNARQAAQQMLEARTSLEVAERKLDSLRRQYGEKRLAATARDIANLEQKAASLRRVVSEQSKAMRILERQALK